MIADKPEGLNVQSTIQGEKIALSFDENSVVHLQSLFIDMYSDPEMAVIREYSTNARDSHVEAGTTRPIDVTLPTPLAPFFRVRDYGIGLSVDDVTSIYSKYGASTKRETNDQVGMLGIGCKSALTYAQQFTLVAIKDGVRIQVSISREEDGSGTMTVVDTSATDEDSGVEIVVPVRRWNDIERKAKHFFSFWDEGTVLINGQPPKRIEGLEITDKLIAVQNLSTDVIVMGNVPYPARINTDMHYSYRLVAFVDIGAVNFTPAREALHLTAKTKATIAQIEQDFTKASVGIVQKAIDAAASPQDALKTMIEWRRVLPRTVLASTYRYKGRQIPAEMDSFGTAILVPCHHRVLSRHSTARAIAAESWPRTVFVHGYPLDENWTVGKKKKLKKWYEDSGLENIESFALMDQKPDTTWIDPDHVIDWPTIKAIKLPRATRTQSGRPVGSYDIYFDGNLKMGVPADQIDTSYPIYYMQGQRHEAFSASRALTDIVGTCTVVALAANRIPKFLRNFSTAEKAGDAVKDALAKWEQTITQEQREALAVQNGLPTYDLVELDEAKIDDPNLSKIIKYVKMDLDDIDDKRRMFQNVLSRYDILHDDPPRNPLHDYPLFSRNALHYHKEHLYDYMNAVYAKRVQDGTLPSH